MSSAPLAVSDLQLSAILRAADPLAPPDRERFSSPSRTSCALSRSRSGDGSLFRMIKSLQREFSQPPRVTTTMG